MKEILNVALVLLLTTASRSFAPQIAPPPRSLVLNHANVVGVTSGRIEADQTVVVLRGRIASIGKFGRVKIPKNTQVVDATGKFLIPGLWDMHAHTLSDELTRSFVFPLEVANGVVGIRDMAGDCIGERDCDGKSPFDIHLSWRRDIESGTLVGPRMVIGTAYIDGSPPDHAGSMVVTNEKEARAAVSYARRRGIDFLKIYGKLSPESYFVLAREAKRQHIVFAGHAPVLIGAIAASNAGQKSEEHLFGVLTACSGREAEFVDARRKAARASGFDTVYALRADQEKGLSYTKSDCTELFKTLSKNKTWMVPTYTYWRSNTEFPFFDTPRLQEDERLRYIPKRLRIEWTDMYARFIAETREDDIVRSRAQFRDRLSFAKRLRDAGIKILAGTDSDVPYTIPGFSLHDELQMLVAGGLTPLEALRTATVLPAEFLNARDPFGTVERGKRADLVLLDADPLADISATRRIAAVIIGGRLFDRETLDKILSDVEELAERY